MSRRMLVDAGSVGETRVVVLNGERLEDFEYEQNQRLPIKGNIYLAKVTRVEPSLQAAFVDYGGERHGFLSFGEIHPDYFRIPVGDSQEFDDVAMSDSSVAGGRDDLNHSGDVGDDIGDDDSGDDEDEIRLARRRSPRLKRIYKIQEVIKRGQIILVQAVKEERGNKGAAMTSYISLAGRFCVLMPNTARGSGISRKIMDARDRKRLREIVEELDLPQGMGLIVRTAGAGQTKAEVRRDFTYISEMWNEIREVTLHSTAPTRIHEEGNLLKRALRDLYHKDIDEVIVAGEASYNTCKKLMKSLMPSHSKKVSLYEGEVPLFIRYGVEEKLRSVSESQVALASGGMLVINQTEALVAIDVNSGRAIRERHIEETALQTNLEAAAETARQLRLRDLAGLVVIDFITMENRRNNKAVESCLREHLKPDRARIQVGHMSPFGLLELSRQRIRPSLSDSIHERCPTCDGGGVVPTDKFAAQSLVRQLEAEAHKRGGTIEAECSVAVAEQLFNHYSADLQRLRDAYTAEVRLHIDRARQCGFHIIGSETPQANSASPKKYRGRKKSPRFNSPQDRATEERPEAYETESESYAENEPLADAPIDSDTDTGSGSGTTDEATMAKKAAPRKAKSKKATAKKAAAKKTRAKVKARATKPA